MKLSRKKSQWVSFLKQFSTLENVQINIIKSSHNSMLGDKLSIYFISVNHIFISIRINSTNIETIFVNIQRHFVQFCDLGGPCGPWSSLYVCKGTSQLTSNKIKHTKPAIFRQIYDFEMFLQCFLLVPKFTQRQKHPVLPQQ